MSARCVWSSIKADVRQCPGDSEQCQWSKILRQTVNPVYPHRTPVRRFYHAHTDLGGALPPFLRQRYILTDVDRHTWWVEAIPVPDISAETVAEVFLSAWFSHFGSSTIVTTDRGRQFGSNYFATLTNHIGTHHVRITAYHPAASEMVVRFHRQLKTSLTFLRSLDSYSPTGMT